MRRSGTGSGGGYGSKNVVNKPVRTGAGAKAAHLGGVSQLGNKIGDHLTNKTGGTGWRGDPLFAGPGYNPTKYGNEIAAKTVCGPGGSRQVMSSRSQGTHGATNPGNPRPVPAGHIIESYGPTIPGRK